MGSWADGYVASLVEGLNAVAVPADVAAMSAYMRHQFLYLGVRAPALRAVERSVRGALGSPPDEGEVIATLDALWAQPHREYRYAGCDLARRHAPMASPDVVDHAARWITDAPWWDTCDALARHTVGEVVRRHGQLRAIMDQWLAGDNLWLTRTAIIHMGGWQGAIDRDWVFAACLARADHPDFFIRKAIGWILRDLAWVDPDAVVAFVAGPGVVLSNLSQREALKNVRPSGSG